jgi:hypothetical protein
MVRPGRQEAVLRPSITEEEDQTGFFSDMMAEFKMNLQQPEQHYLEASMQPSFMEVNERDREGEEEYAMEEGSGTGMAQLAPTPARSFVGGLNHTGGAGLNLTGAAGAGLNLTGAAPSHLARLAPGLNMTGGVGAAPGLNLTGAATPRYMRNPTELNLTGAATPGLGRMAFGLNATGGTDLTSQQRSVPGLGVGLSMSSAAATPGHGRLGAAAAAPSLNLTAAAPPSLNLTTATAAPALDVSDVGPGQADASLDPVVTNFAAAAISPSQDIDPFSQEIHRQLMSRLARPTHQRHGYVDMLGARLPNVRVGSVLNLGQDKFYVTALKGEGGFAKVFAATREDEAGLDSTIAGIDAVLKVPGLFITINNTVIA